MGMAFRGYEHVVRARLSWNESEYYSIMGITGLVSGLDISHVSTCFGRASPDEPFFQHVARFSR